MKCPACKHEKDWDDKTEKKEFISLGVIVTREKEYGVDNVNLYTCPECGCVIMNDF
jgi:predicted RNA-binding Zn-ribbon protein involved in translation (DUF1610 family)